MFTKQAATSHTTRVAGEIPKLAGMVEHIARIGIDTLESGVDALPFMPDGSAFLYYRGEALPAVRRRQAESTLSREEKEQGRITMRNPTSKELS